MVYVIIPIAGDCSDLLERCLADLSSNTHEELHVCVVDNGTSVDVHSMLHSLCENSTYIRFDTNRGFSAAINDGLRRRVVGEHVLLLNDDCFVGPHCVDRMLLHMKTLRKCAVICPMTDGPNMPSLRRGARADRFADVLKALPDIGLAAKALARITNGPEYCSVGPHAVPFFCALLNDRALKAVGPLNQHDFADGLAADDEWCLRAHDLGWTFAYAVDAFASHIGRETFKRLNIDRNALSRAALRKLREDYM